MLEPREESPIENIAAAAGEFNQKIFQLHDRLAEFYALHGKAALIVIVLLAGAAYIASTNRAILLRRAQRGSLRALVAITRQLIRTKDRQRELEALDLLRQAQGGSKDAINEIGIMTGNLQDPYFRPDRDVSALWMSWSEAGKPRAAAAALGAATRVHEVQNATMDPDEELNALIGIPEVKKTMRDIANRAELFKKRELAGLPVSKPALHLIFLGNPGTGKTTVARILGRLLFKIGYLSKGHVVEVSEGELIGQYVGETPIKVHQKIQQALGGILFIDEAYSMMNANTEGVNFASSAIATIVKFMEDFRADLVVIAAGYPKEMLDFMHSNPGLRSRFTEVLTFEDYSVEDMVKIFQSMAKDNHYILSQQASDALPGIFTEARSIFTRNFANGRMARNLFEDSQTFLAARVSQMDKPTKANLMRISSDDVMNAMKKLKGAQIAAEAGKQKA